MKRTLLALLLFAIIPWAGPAQAQLFGKRTKAAPSQRVPELILIVKTDPDDRKRAQAAEELREYDANTFTEIVPVLADVLKNDKKSNVRLEALNSLAKIRPVSATAGQAIERAAAEDDTWRIRWTAKTSLTRYHLAGYVSRKTEPMKGKVTEEPPLLTEPMPLPRIDPAPRVDPSIPRPLPPGTPIEKGPVLGPRLDP